MLQRSPEAHVEAPARAEPLLNVKFFQTNMQLTINPFSVQSVLSDIYAADKTPAGLIPDSSIVSILRKSVARRVRTTHYYMLMYFPTLLLTQRSHARPHFFSQVESANQFSSASRPELADAEKREAAALSEFIPPSMSSAQVDEVLNRILQQHQQQAPESEFLSSNPKRAMGIILKAFYSQVDKSLVDSQMTKDKVQKLLSSQAPA